MLAWNWVMVNPELLKFKECLLSDIGFDLGGLVWSQDLDLVIPEVSFQLRIFCDVHSFIIYIPLFISLFFIYKFLCLLPCRQNFFTGCQLFYFLVQRNFFAYIFFKQPICGKVAAKLHDIQQKNKDT